jgi:hypothetical protein
MAFVQSVGFTNHSLGNPTVATFSIPPAALGGNTHFLITGGSFMVNGQKQFIDISYAQRWLRLNATEAMAAQILVPATFGWNPHMDDTQLFQAGATYNLENILGEPVTTGLVTQVYLSFIIYP